MDCLARCRRSWLQRLQACAGPEANRTRRLDQTSSPVTQIHRPARLATRAASFRSGGRHHSGIPGAIIPLYPGDFVGIRTAALLSSRGGVMARWPDQFFGPTGTTKGRATSCCFLGTRTAAARGRCSVANDWAGSCATIIVRRRDGASVGQIIWPYGKRPRVVDGCARRCAQMILRALKSANSAAPKPNSASTASLCSPNSGAMPGLAGVSENCQGEPCTFSLPCFGWSTCVT